jgi:CheY-like chemotaxis protein
VATALQLVIVEDSEADAELVSRHLAKSGFRAEICRVQTEHDFVTALKTRIPDLIISDFSLPQFDGLRALELATVLAPDTPFIYVSGTIGEERAIEALRRGATDYLLQCDRAGIARGGAAGGEAQVAATSAGTGGQAGTTDAHLSNVEQYQFRDFTAQGSPRIAGGSLPHWCSARRL